MNKNSKNKNVDRNVDMYKAILTLKTVDECMRFFDDLCSVTELRAMEQRFHVAMLLLTSSFVKPAASSTPYTSASTCS